MLVFGSHWQVTGEEKRAIHSRITVDLVNSLSARYGENIPVIVTADFNELSTAPNFQRMITELGLTNCVTQATSVDQIAVRGAVPIASGMYTEDITRYASDHKPVWCDIEIL